MKKTTLLFVTGIFLVFYGAAFAQGTAFTYQGRLNDGANPASGTYDLRFSIYDAAGGGAQQGSTVTNAATAVSNGLFTVTLDFGNQFTGGGRWLEIGVRTNGSGSFTTLSPRQQLTPTPYAIQAANAATAGVATSASSIAAGNIVGTLTTAQLPSGVITNGASGVNFTGTFTGNGSGLTSVPGTLPWQTISGSSTTAIANRGYLLSSDSLATVALPSSASVSDVIAVSGVGSNGWRAITSYVQPALPIWAEQNSGSQSWRSVASSADGNKLVAVVSGGQIYTSADTGMTWTPQTNGIPNNGVAFWNGVTSSADGSKLAAVVFGGQIYTSTNSGATWSAQSSPTANWFAVASSADGSKLVAAVYFGNLYSSTNSGASWTAQTNSGSLAWQSVASSADGNQLVAGVYQGRIYISTNSGVSWIMQTNGIPQSGWKSVSCSADGTKLAAVSSGAYIYTSTNAGASWFIRVSSGISYWNSIAASSDGAKLVAVSDPNGGSGTIVVSTDYGTSWTTATNGAPNAGNVAWQAVASSADGGKLVAVATGVPICTAGPQPVFFNGAVGTTTEFQYVGNGVWRALGAGANQIVGTISPAQLPAGLVTNGASGLNFTGSFSGNGAGLTNVDLLSLNSRGAINVLVQPNAFALSSLLSVRPQPYQVVARDLNGDGRPDLIVGGGNNPDAIILTNAGGGNFVSNATYNLGAGYFPVVVADVNGDGKPDLIGGDFQTNILTVLTNAGGGRFATNAIYSISGPSFSVAIVDVNGDGKVDLIYTAPLTNALGVLTNNGSGGFGSNATYSLSSPGTVVAADFNGDGIPDLLCSNAQTNTLSLLTNNGVGGFVFARSTVVSNNPAFLTLADFNADGKPDVICRDASIPGGASLLTNDGSGGLQFASSLPADQVLIYTPVELNGDGKMDLICPNFLTNSLSLLTNNGSGGFTEYSKVIVGNGPLTVAATDLNADGRLDLACGNILDGTVSVLTNGNVFTANFTGGTFAGDGSGLTRLNASQLTSGTVADARLSTNVALLNRAQTFSASLGLTDQSTLEFGVGVPGKENNAGKIGYQTFSDGLDIVGAGTDGANRKISFFAEGGSSFTGPVTATGFTGEGSDLTSLNAGNVSSGTLADARLSASVSLLGQSIESGEITDGTIVDADISAGAAIADTKLATITTVGKVVDSALSVNVALLNRNPQNFTGTNIFANKVSVGTTNAPAKLLQVGSTASTQDGMIKLGAGNGLGVAREYYLGVPYGGSDASGTNYDFIIQDVTGGVRLDIDWNTGNVGIGTTDPTNKLHVAGGVSATAFVSTSDRNAKENFTPVSPADVLGKVAALPITTWNFKTMKDGRHMGPMAQDFYAAFGLGGGDTTITSMDPDGVALAAIQGLNQKLEETRAELKRRDAENAELRQRMERLEKALLEKPIRPGD